MSKRKRSENVLDEDDVIQLHLRTSLCGALIVDGPTLDTNYKLQATSSLILNVKNQVGTICPALSSNLPRTAAKVVHMYLGAGLPNVAHTYIALNSQEIYLARPYYSLHECLPPESLVHAFAYVDAENNVKISIFDCSMLAGKDFTNLHPFDRFGQLHNEFKKGQNRHVGHHWIGDMSVAAEQFNLKTAPFRAYCLCEVPLLLCGNDNG